MEIRTVNPRPSNWFSYAINALFLVMIVMGIRTWQQRDMSSGLAPPLQGSTLAGLPYQLPSQPAQPVLVHFWATWCPICSAEQDSITAIAQDYPNVITVAMKSGKSDEVIRHMKYQKIDFPVLNDPDGVISGTWGVHALPASFIIDREGQIRFVEVGYTTGIGLKLRLWLAGI